MSKISDLTPQERACFEPIDRMIPGSNLVGIAEMMTDRVSRETKGKIRRVVDEEVTPLLWELQQEYATASESHQEDHSVAGSVAREVCMACRIERAIERIGEVTV